MLQLRVLAAVAGLIDNLTGLASELVRGGVLQELLCLVRHPVSEYRNDACMAEENCDAIAAEDHTITMLVDVLCAFAKLLPQVRPRLALAAVQLCMRCPLPC